VACRHRNTEPRHRCGVVAPGVISSKWPAGCIDWRVCSDCHAWLPLGAATDTAETAIEVRAAELAMRWAPMARDATTFLERHGWYHARDGYAPSIDHAESRAGWLAHAIATHDDAHHATEHGEG
jgi:hypothetical protein